MKSLIAVLQPIILVMIALAAATLYVADIVGGFLQ
jgi:hypothetical protein